MPLNQYEGWTGPHIKSTPYKEYTKMVIKYAKDSYTYKIEVELPKWSTFDNRYIDPINAVVERRIKCIYC